VVVVVVVAGLFEECPADFSFLRMQDTPPSGGDTLWVSGYELYAVSRTRVPTVPC
jgi:alpha-ketoglutarate-dependent taurine dioxygenase